MSEPKIPEILPILPIRNAVMFPRVHMPINVGRDRSIRLIDEVAESDRLFVTVAQTEPDDEDPQAKQLYRVGTAVQIARLLKTPEGHHHVVLQGLRRVRIVRFTQTNPYFRARVRIEEDIVRRVGKKKVEAEFLSLKNIALKIVALDPKAPEEASLAIANVEQPGELANLLTFNLDLPLAIRQQILETTDVSDRVEYVTNLASRELAKIELSEKIQNRARETIEKTQKEFFLRQQLKEIRSELGETEELDSEVGELRQKIENAGLSEAALKQASRELDRLSRIPSASPEHSVSRSYLEWMASLPWAKFSSDTINLRKARSILDYDHYDLDKVKRRIVEFLAVLKLKGNHRGPILCFVGPPGVGKTSLGRSIARATSREFIRASLGGVRDEAEIRGHRRTYVGALPGRVIRGLRDAGTRNPVFMLDEIDKLGLDYHGDPASALLEVLDPEQNHSFVDHYLDVPFDLSDVMFIATANYLDPVPPALRDRMEVIELAGYTEEEKIEIARRHILPRLLKSHGLNRRHVRIGKTALREIIRSYTREAGLRKLEQKLAAVCRGVAYRVASRRTTSISLTPEKIPHYLGGPRYLQDVLDRISIPGIAVGLAWSPTGGEILFIEATSMKGQGKLLLTGHLGEVMKESAQTSLSAIRSQAEKLKIDERTFSESDLHIHVPAGAIPKDGPSAGVAIFLALVSLLTQRRVIKGLAVTGEVTLRGHVLPVGGIKEKLLAAYRARVTTVLLPQQNRRDLTEIPREIRDQMNIRFISNLEQALDLGPPARRPANPRSSKTLGRKKKTSTSSKVRKKPRRASQASPSSRTKKT